MKSMKLIINQQLLVCSGNIATNMKIIGIDPGVNTGIAIYDTQTRKFIAITCLKIHQAMEAVREAKTIYGASHVQVRFEDARLRKWYGSSGREKLQGAGSVKRDSKIWEDFLIDINIAHQGIPPSQNRTKTTAETFAKITGYKGKTNEHARDAAMLIYGL